MLKRRSAAAYLPADSGDVGLNPRWWVPSPADARGPSRYGLLSKFAPSAGEIKTGRVRETIRNMSVTPRKRMLVRLPGDPARMGFVLVRLFICLLPLLFHHPYSDSVYGGDSGA